VSERPARQATAPPHPDRPATGRPTTDPSVSGVTLREVVGAEILVIDRDENVREGMENVLQAAELHVTAVADPAQAYELLRHRFFSVVVVDFDTPTPGAGLEAAAALRVSAPTSAVVLLTPRRSFDDAVAGMRAGAVDVILKSPASVADLVDRISEAAARSLDRRQIDVVLRDVRETYDELLRRFMDAERRALDLEEQISGRAERSDAEAEIRILVIARLTEVAEEMAAKAKPPYIVSSARSGAEGLDRCGSSRFHVVMISDDLDDLPPSMVARSLKVSSPDTMIVGLSGSPTGAVLEMIEGEGRVLLADSIGSPEELLAKLDKVSEVFKVRERELRYLQNIRERHYDILRRYAMLRSRIDRLAP
jgi:DNA-binding NarL/FixJ family response regulator